MTVRTAARTLGLFETFEAERRPMPLSQLAAHAHIPVSSCHALLATLVDRGYFYSIARTREFYPTRRLLDMAQTIVAFDPFLERIRSRLTGLRDQTGETVIIGKLQRDQVLYLDVIEGSRTVRYVARSGEYKPLHSSSIGKALLGTMGPADLPRWLARHGTPRITENTLTDPAFLTADIETSRKRGYFVTRGENVPDVTAIAVPSALNNEWLGIAIAGPSHRMNARVEEFAELLMDTAACLPECVA